MKDLIERLEKAEGPDRELGNEVLLACGWACEEEGDGGPDTYLAWITPDESDSFVDGDQPDPTSSIDAALTLVPAGHFWTVTRGIDDAGAPVGREQQFSAAVPDAPLSFPDGRVWARTPAIALCIAALKARDATTPLVKD